MNTIVLFDQDAIVVDLMRWSFEYLGHCKAVIAHDRAEALLALSCRSDVTAAVVDVASLSGSEIEEFCGQVREARPSGVTVVLTSTPYQLANGADPNVVWLLKPFDSRMLLEAARLKG